MRWGEATAFFGGTFDPPHLGHQEAILGLFEAPGVRETRILVSADPPHKPGRTPAEHRLAMARLAFERLPGVVVDPREIERQKRSLRPSYSFDTLSELAPEFPDAAFVIGTDQLAALPTWHRFPEVLALSHWIVLERRPGDPDEVRRSLGALTGSGLLKPAPGGSSLPCWQVTAPPVGLPGAVARGPRWLTIVPTPARALASREIRESLARTGQPPEGSLEADVASYLKRNRLYGSSGGSNEQR